MKAKIDVTIFHNGDMDIHASIYEELWKDYCTFKKRAAMQQDKEGPRRARSGPALLPNGLLSLFAFFEGVLNSWVKTVIQERQGAGVERQDTLKNAQVRRHGGILLFLLYTKRPGTFCSLYGYINRYEQHDLALIEHIDGQTLGQIETAMEEFFCYVEAMTALRRFPKPNESTTGLVSRSSGMEDCREADGERMCYLVTSITLGFDAGTQSVKVAVYDEDQHCLAMDTAKTHLAYPQPGWVQMDVDEYYRLIKQCMASCSRQMEEKGWDVKNVRAIMGDGIICGIAGIDADGNAITPYVNYLDSRTADDVEALSAQKEAGHLGQRNGQCRTEHHVPGHVRSLVHEERPGLAGKGRQVRPQLPVRPHAPGRPQRGRRLHRLGRHVRLGPGL